MTDLHALIIDDDLTSLQVLVRLFQNEGISSTTLNDSTRLEDTLATVSAIDIVFLDLEMPKPDGYDILTQLRDDYGVKAPIIAYSAYTNEMADARQAGFDGFISKPIKKGRFLNQLDRILNGQAVWETD